MDPLINEWVKKNRAKRMTSTALQGDMRFPTRQEASSSRFKPPLESALMGRDLEFDSEDDAVAASSSEPTNRSEKSGSRPAARKRKLSGDAEVESSKRSRPRLKGTDSRTRDDASRDQL